MTVHSRASDRRWRTVRDNVIDVMLVAAVIGFFLVTA